MRWNYKQEHAPRRGKLRPLLADAEHSPVDPGLEPNAFSRIHPAPRLHWGELTGSARLSLTSASWVALGQQAACSLLWGKDTIALVPTPKPGIWQSRISMEDIPTALTFFMPLMDPPNERKKGANLEF